MTQINYTPGPWQIVPRDKAQSPWIVGDSEGGSIADCEPPGPWVSRATAEANARLIAAAPDMATEVAQCIVELEEVAKILRPTYPGLARIYDGAAVRARATLAKAVGDRSADPASTPST